MKVHDSIDLVYAETYIVWIFDDCRSALPKQNSTYCNTCESYDLVCVVCVDGRVIPVNIKLEMEKKEVRWDEVCEY